MVNNKPLWLQAFWNVKGPIKGKAILSLKLRLLAIG